MGKKVIYWLTPIMGMLFLKCYISNAACNVVYTDYIRLVNSYLPDLFDPAKFLVPDILTRIPLNYLFRIINVVFFKYSTMFDMVLGIIGVGITGFILAAYFSNMSLGIKPFLASMLIMFGLNKWEMLINGSGWVHFMAFACFYYHYYIWDRVYRGVKARGDNIRLIIIPWLTTLLVAGPYCAVYSATMVITYIFCMLADKEKRIEKRKYIIYIACVILPFILYLISNSFAVEEHYGAVDIPITQVLMSDPLFFVSFIIKSFAATAAGQETLAELFAPKALIYALGIIVLLGYVSAFYVSFKYKLYKKSVLPLILTAAGFFNHILIMASRWIFLKTDYGMSSRYALQFQMGTIGIILTFALYKKVCKAATASRAAAAAAVVFVAVVCIGNIVTTDRELNMAKYRREYFDNIVSTGLEFENVSDEKLKSVFQYKSGEKTREALTLLKEKKLNIYSSERTPK